MLVRAIIAVIIGIIATSLLEWAGVLNHTLNVLIGIAVALIVFYGRDLA